MKKILFIFMIGMILFSMASVSAALWDGIQAYWSFEEGAGGSGTVISDVTGSGKNGVLIGSTGPDWINGNGKIGNALNYTSGSGSIEAVEINNSFLFNLPNQTINFWVNPNGIVTSAQSRYTYGSTTTDYFNTFEEPGNILVDAGDTRVVSEAITWFANEWTMVTILMDSNTITRYMINGGQYNFTGTVPFTPTNEPDFFIGAKPAGVAGNFNFDGAIDEFGIWNRILNTTGDGNEIKALYNAGNPPTFEGEVGNILVDLLAPIDGLLLSQVGTNFTANYSSSGTYNLTNATYYVWKEGVEFNKTSVDIEGTSNSTTLSIDSFTLGNYEWNVYVCGKNQTTIDTICSWEISNFTLQIGGSIEEEIYLNNTYETRNETFFMNISLLPGTTLYDSQLYYDGVTYEATETDWGGGNYTMTTTIDVPLLNATPTQLKEFNWVLIYPIGSNFVRQNTTKRTQNVSQIIMGEYNATLKTRAINFSAFDEENSTSLDPFDFYGTFYYWLGNGNIKKNFSISNPGVSNQTIAIMDNLTYHVDATIQYEKTNYVKRNYYLNNATISNATSDIQLFSLLTTSSTTFILEVINEAQLPVEDAYIFMQRYYPGTGTFKTVEVAITDATGSTVGHFEKETEDYRFVIVKDGAVVYQSETQKIILGETPYTITFQIGELISTVWKNYGDLPNLIWSLTYDETLMMWTYTYVDTSGTTHYGRLHSWIEEGLGTTTICNVNSTSNAATLSCNVTGYEGTIYAAGYISRSPELLVYLETILISGLKDVLGMEGLFFSFFIILLLALVGLWNPVVGILLMIVGMCFMTFIGLASFGAVTLWGVVFLGGIILWMMRS